MKKRYQKLMQDVQRFMTLQRRFNEKTTFKVSLKNTLISLSYTVFIMMVPTALIINLFIFDALKYVLIALLVIIVFVSVRLYYYFYERFMIHDIEALKALNLTFMFQVERVIVYSILIAFGLIVLGALV